MQERITQLTDFQWQGIRKILNNQRKRKTDLRMVLNAILWVVRTGSQWRNIDSMYRPFLPIILYYYYSWQRSGIWEKINKELLSAVRLSRGQAEEPSMGAIDSQSVKGVQFKQESKGLDGNKKINGIKRHCVVDKNGYLMAVHISGANEHDGIQGIELLPALDKYPCLNLLRADDSYRGTFAQSAAFCGIKVEFGQKTSSQQGFIPQKGRWQIERTFAWTNFFRRLHKNNEKTNQSAQTVLFIAAIYLLLNKLNNLYLKT